MKILDKKRRMQNRARRVRAKIAFLRFKSMTRPRLSVYKSNSRVIAQIIDDEKARTICYGSTSDKDIKGENPTEKAAELGRKLAKCAKENNIKDVVFDRGAFAYMGKVKALAEAAREEGLNF